MIFEPGRHGFFDDLVTMLTSLSSYMFAMHVSIASNRPTAFEKRPLEEWISYIAPIKTPGFPLGLGRRADNYSLVVFPALLVMTSALDGWPQFIEYELVPGGESWSDARLIGQGNKRMISGIVGAAYANYYSSCEPIIEAQFGNNKDKWPETGRFAWILRNGFAHGGKIKINDSKLRPVVWKVWSVDTTYNGRGCLFDEGMLGVGDVVALMEELDDLVRPYRGNAG